ncbi:MAG: cyclase family protein [Clostridia bacterium]|nr:cyclase family protein [Clostridia bacterium]
MIYDLTQELLRSVVYPGDPAPMALPILRMDEGDDINLTALSLCAHNGTHVDAPRHFIRDGKSVTDLPLSVFVGKAEVIAFENREKILASRCERILLKGCEEIGEELATRLCKKEICLVGLEGQSVGNANVHQCLLSREIVLLEGIRLKDVPEGIYTLVAAPLKLSGFEGSPCRAILLDEVN